MGIGFGANPYASAYLGLTPEQTAQIGSMREAHYKENAPLQEKLFSRKQELRLLWAGSNPEQAQITAKQKEITDLQAKIQEMSTRHQLEARKVLTPEQQQKLALSSPGRGFGEGPGWGRGRMGRRW
jgi:Spy/CpxP family protein refolding chaperone